MPEVLTFSVDTSRLHQVIQETVLAFPTTFEAEMRKHTRLAASELASSFSPKNKEKEMKQIAFAGRKNFYPLPLPNMIGVAKKSTSGGTLWLYASKNKHVLVGVDRENYKLDMDAKSISKIISNNRHRRGKTWLAAGNRGSQHIMIAQKPVVQPDKLKEAVAIVQGKVGMMKATWIKAAADLGIDAKADAWVARHKGNALGFGSMEGNPQKGLFAFVLRSVVPLRAAPKQRERANKVMQGRAIKAAADLRNLLDGIYKKEWKH